MSIPADSPNNVRIVQSGKTESTRRYLVSISDDAGTVYHIRYGRSFSTVSIGSETIFYFDSTGRILGSYLDAVNYQRGLSGEVLRKDRRSGVKSRTLLSGPERISFFGEVYRYIERIRRRLVDLCGEEYERVRGVFNSVGAWNPELLEDDRRRYAEVYTPVAILTPDQYLSVVLQASEGCSWNKCSFCDFYKSKAFRIKTPDEFRAHISRVREFIGDAMPLRKSIFLGDANALIVPHERLLGFMAIIHEMFDREEPPLSNGIYSFLDVFGAERKTAGEYRELVAWGVRRIYIGLESGSDEVYSLLNKQGSPAACVDAVRTIRDAGCSVGLIVLAGAGGRQLAGSHLEETVAAIASMSPDEKDIIYLSPFVDEHAHEYARRCAASGIESLSETEIHEQLQSFKTRLRSEGAIRAKITLYDIKSFIY